MKTATRILITGLTLIVAALVIGFAAPAGATLQFTREETVFLNEENAIGIYGNDQYIVDLGWAIVYDYRHGTSLQVEALILYNISPRIIRGGLSKDQSAATVLNAYVDLNDGSSPSPGGMWTGPLTGYQGELR